jgi:regulatory protein
VSKITALKVQAKDKRRVNVYLDGVFAFGLPDTVAASLRVGQLVSEEECVALRWRDTVERAYERALGFLSYRPRSTEEVARYLAGKQVPDDVAGEVIGRLQQAELLDDQAFARYWVENRESFRPRGTMALRYELRRKGVDDGAIEAAIRDVDESEGAYRAAQAQARRLAGADRESFRRRLGGYLSRRGYAYATVRETVERLWREVCAHDEAS